MEHAPGKYGCHTLRGRGEMIVSCTRLVFHCAIIYRHFLQEHNYRRGSEAFPVPQPAKGRSLGKEFVLIHRIGVGNVQE